MPLLPKKYKCLGFRLMRHCHLDDVVVAFICEPTMSFTQAVTQNFAEPRNFSQVRKSVFQKLWVGDLLDEADAWLSAVDRKWPGMVDQAHCVECGNATDTFFPLLDVNRRLCKGCEASSPAYRLLRRKHALECYTQLTAADLALLPAVTLPLPETGRPTIFCLCQHVVELAEEIFGEDVKADVDVEQLEAVGVSALQQVI